MSLVYTTAEEVMAAIQTLAESVPNMKRVDRHHHENFNNYEYPSSYIHDMRRERRRVLLDVFDIKHVIMFVAFTRDEDGTMETSLNALIEACLDKFVASPTLGGIVRDMKVIRVDTDAGYLEPLCVAIFMLEVQYLTRK